MASPDRRLVLDFLFSSPTYIGSQDGYDISDEPTLRVVVENAGATQSTRTTVNCHEAAN
jgi:hypothetical protein